MARSQVAAPNNRDRIMASGLRGKGNNRKGTQTDGEGASLWRMAASAPQTVEICGSVVHLLYISSIVAILRVAILAILTE